MADANMTYEEAIKNLQIALSEVNQCIDNADVCRVPEEAYVMQPSLEMAIKALEKQIPRRPYVRINRKKLEWVCGNCKIETVEYKDFYCSHCGWKIDWSDDDD